MMMDPTLVITAACLFAICIVAFAVLRAWQGWLELKRQELERHQRIGHSPEIEGGRLDMSDVLEPIFEQAGDAFGRKFEYPKK